MAKYTLAFFSLQFYYNHFYSIFHHFLTYSHDEHILSNADCTVNDNINFTSYSSAIHTATVRLQAGSPLQLSQLIQTRGLRFFGCTVSIWGLPKDWRHPPGRPHHTWLCTLDADLQPHNLGLNSAWKYAQDREHCKHLMETTMLQLGTCAWWWWWHINLAPSSLQEHQNKVARESITQAPWNTLKTICDLLKQSNTT